MNHKRWKILASLQDLPLSANGSPSPLIVQLLRNRGIDDPASFEPFLAGDGRLTGDPFLLPDMHHAVSRIYQALLRGEKITVYGDFDTDGITGTAVLVQGMEALGANVGPYIPSRFEEGHGLKIAALENLKAQGVSLVITVDCGISDNKAASYARGVGLDLIITDHHTLTSELPEAVAVVNPKRPDSVYPFNGLAGAGLAFKLLEALYRSNGRDRKADCYLDMVALGTVTDMVPLVADNRFLTKRGLEVMKNSARPGLRALMNSSGLDAGHIEASDIAFSLGPRLNAAGRVDHAIISYRLLTTSSEDEGDELAKVLETKNSERQKLTEEVLASAREQAAGMLAASKILIASGPRYHAGVHGLVANRLVDEFYRPSIVMESRDGKCLGSARSIPEFDIIAALARCEGFLSQYGGHPGAAGFSLPDGRVPGFVSALQQIGHEKLEGVDLRPEIVIDAEVPLASPLVKNYEAIRGLAPFGKGNPQPVFLSRGVKVIEKKLLSNGGKHVRFKLRSGNVVWPAIGFDFGAFAAELTPCIDIVYTMAVDRWANQETIELRLLDFRPASQT